MLRAVIDLTLGVMILWFGAYGLWSGFRYGVFPGALIQTRASREEKPITFWGNVVFRVALIVVALLYLLVVVWSMVRGIKAP